MALYFSASVGGFLDDTIHAAIPADAREISKADHAALLGAASTGMVIGADADGYPVVQAAPPPPEAELLRRMRGERDRRLRACDFTQMADAPLTASQREAWRLYRQALRDLPQEVADPACIDWPIAPNAGEAA